MVLKCEKDQGVNMKKKKDKILVHILPRNEDPLREINDWMWASVIVSILFYFTNDIHRPLKYRFIYVAIPLFFGVIGSIGVFFIYYINYRKHKKIMEKGIKTKGIVRNVKKYSSKIRSVTYYAVIVNYYVLGAERIWCSPKYYDDLNDYFEYGDSCDVYYLGNKVCLPEYLYKKY